MATIKKIQDRSVRAAKGTDFISLYLGRELYARVQAEAKAAGVSKSEFIRRGLYKQLGIE